MKYNPAIHHRRSIRLKGYDYSQAGLYFVTICVNVGADLCVCPDELGEHNILGEHAGSPLRVCPDDTGEHGGEHIGSPVHIRPHLFGDVINGEMLLNDAGKMIEKWYVELPKKFPDIALGEFVIMPNHFHAIIVNTGIGGGGVGADLRVCPDKQNVCPDVRVCPDETDMGEHTKGEHIGSPLRNTSGEYDILGEHIGSPLHRVVQWFKTMTTNDYIRGVKTLDWQPFNKKLWQRNYWEHIIRNEQSHQRIADYIVNNPINWEKDKFYSDKNI